MVLPSGTLLNPMSQEGEEEASEISSAGNGPELPSKELINKYLFWIVLLGATANLSEILGERAVTLPILTAVLGILYMIARDT